MLVLLFLIINLREYHLTLISASSFAQRSMNKTGDISRKKKIKSLTR